MKARQALEHYAELKDVIALLGIEELGADDRRIVSRAQTATFPYAALRGDRGVHRRSRPVRSSSRRRSPDAAPFSPGECDGWSEARSTWWATSVEARAKENRAQAGAAA